jgi:DNA-binding response OmpR family regulator
VETLYLAEDDPAMREVLSEILSREGFAVIAFSDGGSLLEAVSAAFVLLDEDAWPAALIVDLRMPGLSGIEVVDMLRHYDTKTPVIMITAFPEEQLHLEARRHNVAAVLSKPFSGEALLATLRRLLA